MKSIKKILLLFATLPVFASCQSTLEDGYLDFEKLNFSTFSAKQYYSKSLKAEWADFHKKRKSNQKEIYFFQSEADTIDINGSDFRMVKPEFIMFRQTGVGRDNWNDDYNLGFLKNLKFDEVHAITDLKNNLLLISGINEKASKDDLMKFVNSLTKLYGNPTVTSVSSGMSSYDLKKWDFKDKKIVLVSDGKLDHKNLILNEDEKNYIKDFETGKYLSTTIYICKNEYYDVFKKMSTRIGFMTKFEK